MTRLGSAFARGGVRDVAALICLLVITNLVAHYTVADAATFAVPVGALIALVFARHRGFSWSDLGLARNQCRRGLMYGAAVMVPVATVAVAGAVLPVTRSLYRTEHFTTFSAALWSALVVIPFLTVIPEEILFRSTMNGALQRCAPVSVIYVVGAGLFGLWHISSSLGLTASNAGLTDLFGSGTAAQAAGVIGAVTATTFAGLVLVWLRRRSNSVIAPIALHWALNGAGALAAALAWQLG